MGKKKKYSVWIAKEFTVVAEDDDQATLKVQQKLHLTAEEIKEFTVEVTEIDMEYEKLCERGLHDGVDIS